MQSRRDVVAPRHSSYDPSQDLIEGGSKEETARGATLTHASCHREIATALPSVHHKSVNFVVVVPQECHQGNQGLQLFRAPDKSSGGQRWSRQMSKSARKMPRSSILPCCICQGVGFHLKDVVSYIPSAHASLSQLDALGGVSSPWQDGCGDHLAIAIARSNSCGDHKMW